MHSRNFMLVLFASVGLTAVAAGRLQREQIYVHDDFEDASVVRLGTPTLVKGDISPGMLTPTGKGAYVVKKPTVLREDKIVTPTADGLYFETEHRLYSLSEGAEFVGSFVSENKEGKEKIFSVLLSRRGESVSVNVCDEGKSIQSRTLEVTQLPADVGIAVSAAGKFIVRMSSLVDSSSQELTGMMRLFESHPRELKTRWTLQPVATSTAELTVDEYVFACATDAESSRVPWSVERAPTFDPEKAGWKMVFEDEFDGDSVDWTNKWFMPYYDARSDERKSTYALTDGKGHLKIKVDFNKADEKRGAEQLSGNEAGTETNQLGSISLYTKKAYGYGYYEAKLKFTSQNGFWSAFWMYGDGNVNPFVDGFEIDGFEDYYTRRRDKEGKPGLINDHNLHLRAGLCQSKSWNFGSSLSPDFDAWHVMGIKWTPFEISYYMDGKLLKTRKPVGHSPFDTVTFDAFHHGACASPVHAVLSCVIMHADWNKRWQDLTGCEFPAYFNVDYVRIWEYPNELSPRVKWDERTLSASSFAPTGSVMRFSADVSRAPFGAGIRAAYLFDNGFFMACRTEPPYDFELEMSEAAYKKSAYCRPGRQGIPIKFNGMPHVFHVYVQDEEGRVGRTAEPVVRMPVFGESHPFQGKPIPLPGVLSPAHFDEGGIPVGYYRHPMTVESLRQDLTPRPSFAFRPKDHAACSADGSALDFVITCEWYNYTVEIAETGTYRFEFAYGTPGHGTNRLDFYVDGFRTASAALEYHDGIGFERDRNATIEMTLPKGRHKLTLYPIGPLSIGTMTVDRKK